MSKTTYPPKSRIVRPSNKQVEEALATVKKHKIDWWNPWPDEVEDNTIRWLRKQKMLDTFNCFSGINTSGNPFGYNYVEDVITEKGLECLSTLTSSKSTQKD